MQDIEHNMEELFRKAADNYPLRVDDPQWDKVAAVVTSKPVARPPRKNALRVAAGLLLLLLFLFLADGILTGVRKTPGSKAAAPSSANNTNSADDNNKGEGIAKDHNTGVHASRGDNKLHRQTGSRMNTLQIDSRINARINTKTSGTTASSTLPMAGKSKKLIEREAENTAEFVETSAPTIERLRISPLFEPKRLPLARTTPDETGKPAAIKNQPANGPAGLYVGAITGPLFNEVKNQGLKKTGFSLGVIAGYRLKNRVALEAGLLFAKKPYYSAGQFFNADKISGSMPQGMQILSLEGCNYAWEVPVKVKYDFFQRGNSSFFSSAGITSYIMTNEKNDYLVSVNGVQQTMISSYSNKSRSFAATLDISAGYEHKIGRGKYFRIEPYIQIPLKGMGVGAMQMTSTGLRVGVTRFRN
jgi:hypothetical protein